MSSILFKGAHVVSPKDKLDAVMDVLVQDGKIAQIAPEITGEFGQVMDCEGKYLSPGLVDMHVHFRDPGLTYKEDILTGAAAAAAGGFTSVMCMPNTKPITDSPEVVDYIVNKAKDAKCKVYPIAAITRSQQGKELVDFEELVQHGAVAFSEDGKCVKNARMMRDAMVKAHEAHSFLISHCEDDDLTQGGIMHKGEVSEELGVKGIDRLAEDVMTAREAMLSEDLGLMVHIAHVSTWGSLNVIRDAKRRGVNITCETCPHYFVFDHSELLKRDARFRMNPPLREKRDVEAVLKAIQDGTVDAIVTDHAPHSAEEKQGFETAMNGIIGLETSFALSYTYLVRTARITLPRLIELMSANPARICGVQAGGLAVGDDADLFVYDLDEPFVVDENKFQSKARNMPFGGMKLFGKIKCTYLRGVLTHQE